MKFKVLSRDMGEFFLTDIEAKDEEEALDELEECIITNTSSDWLLTLKEFEDLKELLKGGKKKE